MICAAVPVKAVAAVAVTSPVVAALIVFRCAADTDPAAIVTRKSLSRLTLSPLLPSFPIRVLIAAAVPVIVVAAVAVTSPVVFALIVFK